MNICVLCCLCERNNRQRCHHKYGHIHKVTTNIWRMLLLFCVFYVSMYSYEECVLNLDFRTGHRETGWEREECARSRRSAHGAQKCANPCARECDNTYLIIPISNLEAEFNVKYIWYTNTSVGMTLTFFIIYYVAANIESPAASLMLSCFHATFVRHRYTYFVISETHFGLNRITLYSPWTRLPIIEMSHSMC